MRGTKRLSSDVTPVVAIKMRCIITAPRWSAIILYSGCGVKGDLTDGPECCPKTVAIFSRMVVNWTGLGTRPPPTIPLVNK